ncbi:hypothetical protein ART_2754 [Arthrobacter sp. PAMC 25486]|nr:hypothetical protein ART_2754 [Arthrobacter sp. PAMC 25486]
MVLAVANFARIGYSDDDKQGGQHTVGVTAATQLRSGIPPMEALHAVSPEPWRCDHA